MGSEIDALLCALDGQRRAAIATVNGLPDEALRRPVLPSGWTCLGMLQHLTVIERYWFRWAVAGEDIAGTDLVDGRCRVVLDGMTDDNEWLVAPHVRTGTVIDRYRSEARLADAAVAGVPLDAPPRRRDPPWTDWFADSSVIDVRWILLHMIAETARHAGHLDAVREMLDGHTASS